jgi:hypothetical protein
MKVSRTAIFLFELMMVILIFALASAICTNIFGKAYEFSTESKALTMAVLKSESIAEEFKAGKAPAGDVSFDKDWKPVEDADSDSAAYIIRSNVTIGGDMKVMDISVEKVARSGVAAEDVYELQVKSYGK